VRNPQHGHSLPRELADQLGEPGRLVETHSGRGLVQQQDPGPGGEGAQDLELLPVGRAELLSDLQLAEPSKVVADRVAAARARAARRLAGTRWRLNAQVPGPELRRAFRPAPGALVPLERAMDLGEISARGVDRIVRMSWTLADLAGVDRPGTAEIGYALGREGKTSEAQREIAELREKSKSAFVDPYLVSLIYLGMGKEQVTLQWLNRAYVVRSPFLISISTEPKWKAMIEQPELQAFLAKMTPQERTRG